MSDYLEHLNNLDIYRRMLRRERVFRDRNNPFDVYDDHEFHRRFRFSKENVLFINDLVKDKLSHPTKRNHSLSSEIQLCTALRYFATGSFQIIIGDSLDISQPTVSRCVADVCIALAKLQPRFIKFPVGNAAQRASQDLFNVANFPSVVGCLDCTHIPIFCFNKDRAEKFRNRKEFYSINTQVVCNANGLITNVVARWPGATHNSRIFHESSLKTNFENGQYRGILLGDKGYPSFPYLCTPLHSENNVPEHRYNVAHKKTRCIVERCFGVWKRRFPCISVVHSCLRVELSTILALIIALAVLHNIALLRNDPAFDENNDIEYREDEDDDDAFQIGNGNAVSGRIIHDHFS